MSRDLTKIQTKNRAPPLRIRQADPTPEEKGPRTLIKPVEEVNTAVPKIPPPQVRTTTWARKQILLQ